MDLLALHNRLQELRQTADEHLRMAKQYELAVFSQRERVQLVRRRQEQLNLR